MKTLLTLVVVALLGGCAQITVLNDPTRSSMRADVATMQTGREALYEVIERGTLSVGYSLRFGKDRYFTGYLLRLVIINASGDEVLISPAVSLRDSTGFLIPAMSFNGFMAKASALAGTPVPQRSAPTSTYYHSGTVTSQSGQSYDYRGYSSNEPRGFAAGLAQGLADGAVASAERDRRVGQMMLQWADAHWLRREYRMPAKSSVVGVLMFPATTLGNLPLRLEVTTGGERFEFVTVKSF